VREYHDAVFIVLSRLLQQISGKWFLHWYSVSYATRVHSCAGVCSRTSINQSDHILRDKNDKFWFVATKNKPLLTWFNFNTCRFALDIHKINSRCSRKWLHNVVYKQNVHWISYTGVKRILTRGRIAGDFSFGKFLTLDCFGGGPIGMLVDSMRGEIRRNPLKIVPLHGRSVPPSNTWCFGPPHPERHDDWLRRFCRAHGRERQTDWQTTPFVVVYARSS